MRNPKRDAATPLTHRAYDTIKDKILTFQLAPGSLVIAQELAGELGTSVTPIHTALQRLSTERLAQVIPRSGYVIAPITFADVQEIFSLRITLESAAIELGLHRATDRDLAEFRRLVDTTSRQGRDGIKLKDNAAALRAIGDGHDGFHLAVASLSRHSRLIDMTRALLDQGRRLTLISVVAALHAAGTTPSADPVTARAPAHDDIAELICARDREGAVTAMADHTRAGYRRVVEHLATLPTDFLRGSSPASLVDFRFDTTELDVTSPLPFPSFAR